jgi:hypothetical protein
MSDNLKDILSNLNKEIEQDKLLDYLNKNLSATDAHEIEKQMADDPFVNDAVEGLSTIKQKNIVTYTEQLNQDLKNKLQQKKNRNEKRKLKNEAWVSYAILLILLLCVLGYVVIKKLNS